MKLLLNKYTIGITAIIILLGMVYFAGRASAPEAPALETTLQGDLATWGTEYNAKAEEKKQHEAATLRLDADLHTLSCKALATRMALCQRGSDVHCKQEQEARAAMIAGYGAPYEDVCKKDFTVQATGS